MNKTKLRARIATATKQLIELSVLSEESWAQLVDRLRRAGLTDTVTFEQWAKFQWTRHPVNTKRADLINCATLQETAVAVVSDNLQRLFERELSETSLLILHSLDARLLDTAIAKLRTSELTGTRVANLILQDAIQADLDQKISLIFAASNQA